MAKDPIRDLIREAFDATVAAEKLIWAAGRTRFEKDEIIKAHSALLQLKLRYHA